MEESPFAVVGGADLEHGPGQPQPVAAVLGGYGRRLSQQDQRSAKVAALEGRIGVGLQRRRGLVDDPGLGLDLGLEPDRRVRQIVPLERLVGGVG